MCGIAGALALDSARIDPAAIARMNQALRHRGPDGEGIWSGDGGRIVLGHRRLAVVDLAPRASQPMHYEDRYTLTFNGEIYNYLELRTELEGRGFRFRTESDTEVLLAAWACHGEEMFRHLDGMFAFALWDRRDRVLVCARDRFGERPLYYQHDPGRHFVFGSEMKALAAYGLRLDVDPDMLWRYLAYDLVEDPADLSRTFYRGARRLEAGHYLRIDTTGRVSQHCYWTLAGLRPNAAVTLERAAEELAERLTISVRRRLRTDVPVGSSLSGGLDSSTVVALVEEVRRGTGHVQKTFSARFPHPVLDEGRYMHALCSQLGLDAHHVWPDVRTLVEELPRIFWHQEEPFGTTSIVAQWAVMRLAAESSVTVLLDGQGADEILAGYVHFATPFLRGLLKRDPAEGLRQAARFRRRHGANAWPTPVGVLDVAMPELSRRVARAARLLRTPPPLRHLAPELVAAHRGEPSPFRAAPDLDSALRYAVSVYGLGKLLRFADRSAMAFSREIRLPFLSHEVVEYAFSLPEEHKLGDGWPKRVLRHAMARRLPPEITWRVDKLGFETPQREWLDMPEARALIDAAAARLKRERLIVAAPREREWSLLMAATLLDCRLA